MASITLRGREIPLVYTVLEMKTMQEEVGAWSDLQYLLFGKNKDDGNDKSDFAGPKHLETVAKLIRILGNAGLEENGESADLTDKRVMRAMKPAQLLEAINACVAAMNEGMASEIPEKQPEGPVDVTLEEMNKKKERDG